MSMTLPEIINENNVVVSIVLVVFVIGLMLQTIKSLIHVYEDVFLTRYFKRLNFISTELEASSETSKYLSLLKENEAFKVASGINSSPEKMEMLMDIYSLGFVSNTDLKKIALYLKPENEKVFVNIDWFDRFQFAYSYLSALVLVFMGIIMVFYIVYVGQGFEKGLSLIMAIVFSFMAVFVGRDYRVYKTLKELVRQLIDRGMIANPDINIGINISWK